MKTSTQVALAAVIIAIIIVGGIFYIQQKNARMCAARCPGVCGSNWMYGSRYQGYEYNVLNGCYCLCTACDLTGCRTQRKIG